MTVVRVGSASFLYDQLSRISSETRTFSGLPNSYTINYGYNIGGLLTSVTDPMGAQVSYVYDSTGRLSSMPASGYEGVTSFVSSTQYRASGAVKRATYGNVPQLELSYNSRLQLGQYQITGLHAWSGGPAVSMGASMSYYNDGRSNTVVDLNDSRFDRKYEFDFSARLREAYSGVEAHGAAPPPLAEANSPYRQTYSYDEWNNVTLRAGRIWSAQNEYDTASYSHDNKHANWVYDAAGNITFSYDDGGRTYDAAGRPVSFSSGQNWQVWPNWPSGNPDGPALETQDTFDGTGQIVKHVHHVRHDETYDNGAGPIYWMSDTTTTSYYLHSTVLGGKTIAQLDQNGNKVSGYVYAGGVRIATQTISAGSSSVQIELTNPVTGAAVQTDAAGNYATRHEPDPLGRDLTNVPEPGIVFDPLFSSKWNEPMPLEYQAHWTGELESGLSQYLDTMDMVRARAAYERWKRSEMTSNPDRRIWEEILNRNPNVGVVDGEETYWGADAAAFLAANSGSITVGKNGIILRNHPQNPGATAFQKRSDTSGDSAIKVPEVKEQPDPNRGKWDRCFEGWRFSTAVSEPLRGTSFHGPVKTAAGFLELSGQASLAGDGVASGFKAHRVGIGAPENPYASGLNAVIKRTAPTFLFPALKQFGTKATPVLSGAGAFTFGYNLSVGVGCAAGVMQ